MGFLDDAGTFIKSPEGIGVMSAVFGGLAGARRNQPINSLGQAGVAGLLGYSKGLEMQRTSENDAMSRQLRQMQFDVLKGQYDKQKWLENTAQQFYQSPQSAESNALSAGAKAGSIGPTVANAQLIPHSAPTPARFDQSGFVQAVMQRDPLLGMQMQNEARKAGEVKLGKGEVVYDAAGKRLYGNEQQDLQFVPGDEYRPDRLFDKNSGRIFPSGGMPQSQPGSDSPVTPTQYDKNAPWRDMPVKQQDQFRKSIYEQESKKLNDIRDAVTRGRDVMRDLERFGELNRETGSGGLYDKLAPFNWHFGTNENEMVSIQNRLAPMARPAGSGATSNWEGLQYLSSLPGIDKPGPANKAIREDYQRRFDSALKELQFKESYLAKYGHLNGADSAFQELLQEQSGNTSAAKASAAPALTSRGKMLNQQQREALDIILKSGDPSLIAQARKKGWIQ